MFPYNEILKVFKSKIWPDIWNKHPNKTKFQLKSVREFRSYEHLKFRPTCRLKYKLWRHNYVIVVTSQNFLLPMCRIHQAWYCAKFHDHRSNNNEVMMGGGGGITCQKGLVWMQNIFSGVVNTIKTKNNCFKALGTNSEVHCSWFSRLVENDSKD